MKFLFRLTCVRLRWKLLPVFMAIWMLATAAAAKDALSIIPAPKTCDMREGVLALTETSRVVASNNDLAATAAVVAEEIKRLVGLSLDVAADAPRAGDIMLEIDSGLCGEAYVFDVNDMANVRAGNVSAVAQATTTLLQSLKKLDDGVVLPRMVIRDEPAADYRGVMVDCGRHWHSPETLKQLVILCRWYKVRYLHLHLSDDPLFTFPSTAMPELCQKGAHYSLADLRELERYSQDRGVTILPEVDVPGHATSLVQAMPELFGTNPLPAMTDPGQTICVGREEVYRALDTLVGEICDVFRASPYIHIGGDEVEHRYWANCSDTRTYMDAHGIDSLDELYRHFLVRMNDIVKRHGKKTIVWEGFSKIGKTCIPRDVTVMVYECKYNVPQDLLADGYHIINTAWQPLYISGVLSRMWSPECIYRWNYYRWENWWEQSKAYKNPITVEPTPQVLGAQMCAWELVQEKELPLLRDRLAAMSERAWNPDATSSFADFSRRFQVTDAGLETLLCKP